MRNGAGGGVGGEPRGEGGPRRCSGGTPAATPPLRGERRGRAGFETRHPQRGVGQRRRRPPPAPPRRALNAGGGGRTGRAVGRSGRRCSAGLTLCRGLREAGGAAAAGCAPRPAPAGAPSRCPAAGAAPMDFYEAHPSGKVDFGR